MWATVRAPYFLASATPAFTVAWSSDGSPGCPSTLPSSIMNLMKSDPRARSWGTKAAASSGVVENGIRGITGGRSHFGRNPSGISSLG